MEEDVSCEAGGETAGRKADERFSPDSPGYGLPEGTAGRGGVDMRQEDWLWSGVHGACVMKR